MNAKPLSQLFEELWREVERELRIRAEEISRIGSEGARDVETLRNQQREISTLKSILQAIHAGGEGVSEAQKLLLCKALDGLWGACDSGRELCDMLVDPLDGRIENMRHALSKAQDAILELNESFGIEKH